ncbi:MAG: hypothetical protein HKN47_00375 [Pirellulaceae bacterium]|nr:hypothetical protein [Pirellulaceae bacterium]
MSALGYAFARAAYCTDTANVGSIALTDWIGQLESNARLLRQGRASPLQWQQLMDRLYATTPLAEFKDHLNFDQLRSSILDKMPIDRPEFFQSIRLDPPVATISTVRPAPRQTLITKVAHVRKGHSVPPHGHSNMVSAFLCLSGQFEVRLFDRLDDRDNELVVRSSVHQRAAGAGTWSSISDYRDNVHWLTAKTDDCYLFSCKMLSVEPDLPLIGRINIDLKRCRNVGGDTYVAAKITAEQARSLY